MMKKSIFVLLLSASMMISGIAFSGKANASTEGLPSDNGEIYQGIDVSQWQGYIDFSRVYDSGIRVVYIRAGEGSTYQDPFFERNYNNAKAAGLKVGAYFYVTAKTTQQADWQAHFFASLLEGKSLDCRPVMDFENLVGLDDAQVRAIARTFIEKLQEYTGKEVMIYSDISNARRLDDSFSAYPLWVAEYGVNTVQDPYYWESWSGWQYTDEGRISGINGYVDRDYFTSTVFLSDPSPMPSPGQPPKSESIEYIYTVMPGDTLWSISRKFNTTINLIVEENNIVNPNLIYAGEQFKIQAAATHLDQSETFFYTIHSGDTLYAIALRYHTTVAELVTLNEIRTPNLIYAGQVIKIPSE